MRRLRPTQKPRVYRGVLCLRQGYRGQAIMEYLLLFGVVAAAITGMMVYAKRGIQAGLKVAADDLTPFPGDPEKAQIEGMRQETGDTRTPAQTLVAGLTVASDSSATTTQQSSIDRGAVGGGGSFVTYNPDRSVTNGNSTSKVVAEIK